MTVIGIRGVESVMLVYRGMDNVKNNVLKECIF